ncbi:MAG: MobC family plasmid mobilization relaxosome protein [Lachnospiraceae bacterium]|nr:MobC family plasmid mobilization relaxosome protein [Lachnospiraceae bacterium]
MNRNRDFKLRLSDKEYEKLRLLAEKDERSKTKNGGKNLSAYVRQCVFIKPETARKMEVQKELRNIRYQINKIGVNINQVTHKINAGFGSQLDIEMLEEELKKLNDTFEKMVSELGENYGDYEDIEN